MIIRNEQKGFTLLEVLLYLSLSFIMVVILGNMGIDVLHSRTKANAEENVLANTQIAMLKITEAVQNAQSMVEPEIGSSSAALILLYEDGSTVQVHAVSGRLLIEEEDSSIYLTDSGIEVQDLRFINVSSERREAVRIFLGLESVRTSVFSRASSSAVTTVRVNY